MIDVSIIIINYKNYKMTIDAVNSIVTNSSGFSYEIIIVDNSEDQKEIKALNEGLGSKVTVVDSKGNLGFGQGNNLGASYAKGKYLYFINNDTLLLNNAIYELYKVMEEDKQIGIVGSNLYTKDKEPNHSFIPFEKNYHNDKKMISLWYILLSKLKRKRMDFNFKDKIKQINGYVCGASLFIGKDSFEKLGGFDKDIFMYAEESLLCYQLIHNLNLKVCNVPSSKIIHFEGANVEKKLTDSRASAFANGNSIYYLKAFGYEESIRYLKMMIKKYKRINKIKTILKKGNKDSFIYEKAYINRLNEIQG